MLTFDAPTHTYRWNGVVVPSVTQVLEAEGISDFSMVPADVLEIAKARGTAVHLATQYLDEDRLDWSTVPPDLFGYLEAWERFKADTSFKIIEIEKPVYRSGFAGTIDRVGLVCGVRSVVDIKSGCVTKAAAIQTAAYGHAYDDRVRHMRYAVQLNADGTYGMIPFDADPIHDLNIFMAALTMHNYKRGNK